MNKNRESNWLETVKQLVKEQDDVAAPTVTCGSSEERKWWPPYAVPEKKQ
ncbi:hypothetical protein LZC95_37855 [Pendulispora brunnea]|uniref:Uncharacterized protein n=1 Tax=Pendulispora brunnea TaxID=2905690 RepID=A0ABZ2K0D7_9BACT